MDIILQGPLFNCTLEAANKYSKFDFIDKVIISHWDHEPRIKTDSRIYNNTKIVEILTKDPENIGKANINRQIISTQAGLELVTSNICVKMRSDQLIEDTSFLKLYEYFNKISKEETPTYLDGAILKSKIGVLGIQRTFPFHPQDHIFWGYTEDIKKLFDIPLQDPPLNRNDPLSGVDYARDLRCTILIGVTFHARFDERIKNFLDNKEIYLLDKAPKRNEAMQLSEEYKDKIFKPFPKIDMYWEKYKSGYWYDMYTDLGERYGDE